MGVRRLLAVFLLLPILALTGAAPSGAAPVASACPAGEVPDAGFADVPAGDAHADAVDCVAWWEIGRGFDASTFGPLGSVTRGQAATLLGRLLSRVGADLPASPADAFGDDAGSPHQYPANRLAAVGVLQGTAPGTLGIGEQLSRAAMASTLARALDLLGATLPDGPDAFADDDGSVHEDAIDALAAAGIVRGVAGGGFAPSAAVTRAQLASFLVRTLEHLAAAGLLADNPATAEASSTLKSAGGCDALLGHIKEHALEVVGPYGLYGGGPIFLGEPVPAPAPAAPPSSGGDVAEDGGGGAGGAPTGGSSGTNNQESGVDEADIVKTDGDVLYAVVDGTSLHVVDITGASPVVLGSTPLPGASSSELLLDGDRLLVLSTGYGDVVFEGDGGVASDSPVAPGYGGPTATLTLLDVTQPATPAVIDTATVDGSIVSARMVGGVARVVLRSEATSLPFVYPDGSTYPDEASAEAENRRLVEQSTIADWVPSTDGSPLLACDDVQLPPTWSGLGMVSVLTADLAGSGIDLGASTGLLAGGDLVYASPSNLYVATARWPVFAAADDGVVPVDTSSTDIHAFSIEDPAAASYRASGSVPGLLLNQFSMSEFEGVLRVASTNGFGDAAASQVTTLEFGVDSLVPIGSVGDLGRGERIYAVRFVGAQGYVVTFRQIDPLYVLDLSDPTAPTVAGELEILGYSAYLHPVSETRLLGVGVAADAEGRRTGVQVSLFDVSDPANPTRVSNLELPDAYTEVEYDHRAFLYWAPAGRAVLPFERFAFDETTGEVTDQFLGAVGIAVDVAGGSLSEAGRATHTDDVPADDFTRYPGIRRSIAVGDRLVTVSSAGVEIGTLSDLAETGFAAFSS